MSVAPTHTVSSSQGKGVYSFVMTGSAQYASAPVVLKEEHKSDEQRFE